MDQAIVIRLFNRIAMPQAINWCVVFTAAADEFGIHTDEHQAMWLSVLGHESAGLTALVEDLHYSAKRLAQVWPFRFATNPRAVDPQPNALAQSIGGNPQAVANTVYSGRMGNGGPETGRGYLYRGRYPAHLTGYDNYMACFNEIGIPDPQDPDALLQDLEGMARVSGWFWRYNGCGRYDDFRKVSQVWNFGSVPANDPDPVDWQKRLLWYQRARPLFGLGG